VKIVLFVLPGDLPTSERGKVDSGEHVLLIWLYKSVIGAVSEKWRSRGFQAFTGDPQFRLWLSTPDLEL